MIYITFTLYLYIYYVNYLIDMVGLYIFITFIILFFFGVIFKFSQEIIIYLTYTAIRYPPLPYYLSLPIAILIDIVYIIITPFIMFYYKLIK